MIEIPTREAFLMLTGRNPGLQITNVQLEQQLKRLLAQRENRRSQQEQSLKLSGTAKNGPLTGPNRIPVLSCQFPVLSGDAVSQAGFLLLCFNSYARRKRS
jgi:hypothetical protein